MRIHLILGPTGSGKTAAAVRLAADWNAPVVSIDRFQCFPEMGTTSGRPTTSELAGTTRFYLDNRTIAQGELTAAEAYRQLRRLLHFLATGHDSVILEGGSISLGALVMTGETLSSDVTMDLLTPDVDDPAYIAAIRRRVTHMFTIRPSLVEELTNAWRYREQRAFVATVCGLDTVLAWCRQQRRSVSALTVTSEERSELIHRITHAHLEYARLQITSLRSLERETRLSACRHRSSSHDRYHETVTQ